MASGLYRRRLVISNPLRVLVADDQPLTTWAVATALTSRGHEVVTAGSREEACARLLHQRFDVVVMSCRIEDRDMSDVLRGLTHYPSATRLVLLCDADETMPAPPRGVVLGKPFELTTLLASIDPAGVGADARSGADAPVP